MGHPGAALDEGSMTDTAFAALARGWTPLPLRPKAKTPLLETWAEYQNRRPTETEVRDWWQRWPDANLGIVTGAVSGLLVLDVDGLQGEESLRGRHLPPTPTSRTGRGTHYLFRHPGGTVANRAGLLPGIDIRGDGGYIVAPPSVHPSGRLYEWAIRPEDEPLTDPPSWLLDLLRNPQNAFTGHPEGWVEELLQGVSKGQRNDAAARLAGHYLGKGLPVGEVEAILLGWNTKNRPPLAPEEIRRTVASIAAAENRKGLRVVGTSSQEFLLPLPDGSKIPFGWWLGPNGLGAIKTTEQGEERITVCPTPAVVSKRFRDIDQGTERLAVAFYRDGAWREVVTDRKTLADPRAILNLANEGLPVNSENARGLVKWFGAFEQTNLAVLPLERVTSSMGWKDGPCFILGDRTLLDGGVRFDPEGPEEKSLPGALTAHGSLNEWLSAMLEVTQYPRVLFGVAASLAAPLLKILEAPSFLVDYCGPTSQGKTSALQLAASVWGLPERDRGLIRGWDATKVFLERRAGSLNHLPLFLDDSQEADPRSLGQAVYLLANGVGRGRGATTGSRKTATWRTVTLSTGETPLTSFTEQGGAKARVITLWGSPFGSGSLGETVRRLKSRVIDNHGHAGEAFIRWLIEHEEDWPGWREQYRNRREELAARFRGNAVAERLAEYFTAVDLAGSLANTAFGFPWDADLTPSLLHEVARREVGESHASRAFAYLQSWAVSHLPDFYPGIGLTPRSWAGVYREREYVAVLPHFVKSVLAEGGFNYESALREWRELDWLLPGSDGKNLKVVKLDGQTTKAVYFPWTAWEDATGPPG